MNKKIVALIILLIGISMQIISQTVIPVGGGSYASKPLDNSAIDSIWKTEKIWVSDTNTRPIPTNDWWTDLVFRQYGGNLWAHPIVVKPENLGYMFYGPKRWSVQDMVLEYPLNIKGIGFNPIKAIAKDWSDWTVVMSMVENSNKYMDVTFGHGLPFTWTETKGIVPQITIGNGYTLFDDNGNTITLPLNKDHFGISYQGYCYGVFLPSNTSITDAGNNTITLNLGTGSSFFVLASLPVKGDLSYFYQYAYSIPRKTTVTYNYHPTLGKIDVNWNLTTQNLKGGSENKVIQGFIPHHYKKATSTDVIYNGKQYACARGLLKCATGTSFTFTYKFNGILPNIPAPKYKALPNPYDSTRMKLLIDNYSTNTGYNADTYWGGKDVLYYAQYMQMAKETNNQSAFNTLLNKTKVCLTDWFTYTPGETAHYFARYNNWKGLVGFKTSYGSEIFTDNHFHYGYFIYASALLGLYDHNFLLNYGPMARLVAKQYANWDRNDLDFPLFRTFDQWEGHSWASGISGDNGNNQESSSEAMQSWGGLFLMGSLLNDTAMRDAGVFGYVSESNAVAEYWFDRDKTNFPSSYTHTMAGMVWSGAVNFGTWFSGEPSWIHGIQWIPISPILNYLVQDTAYARADFIKMMNEANNAEISTYNKDLGNIVLSYVQMFDPNFSAKKFDDYWTQNLGIVKDNYTAGISYYNIHSNRNLGVIQWDYYTTLPSSTVYYNPTTKVYTYIAYNPEDIERTCDIYKYDGTKIGSFIVPPHKQVATHLNDSKLTSIEIKAPTQIVDVNKTLQFKAIGYDQYGTIIPITETETWAVNTGGTIDGNGLFTATTQAYPVKITLLVNGVAAYDTIRVGSKPFLNKLNISPSMTSLTYGQSIQFTANAEDQYGNNLPIDKLTWSASGGTINANGLFTAGSTSGSYSANITLGDNKTSALIIVHPALPNIALNKPATASTQNQNTAAMAVDGNLSTRWESAFTDPNWLSVDLQNKYILNQVIIRWEPAYSSVYTIDVSDDGTKWTTIFTQSAGKGGVETINLSGTGRYIRINGTKRGTAYGHSVWEFEVYGSLASTSATKILISPSSATVSKDSKTTFTAYGVDNNWNPASLNGSWAVDGGGSIDSMGIFSATNVGGPYSITYNNNGLNGTAQINVIVDASVSIKEPEINHSTGNNELIYYPNPTKDFLYIKTFEQTFNIKIFDLSGQLMIEKKFNGYSSEKELINLSNLAEGIYIIQILGEKQNTFDKIIKLK